LTSSFIENETNIFETQA